MFALLWMAIFVDSAFTAEGYKGFSYAYAGFLGIISYLWWRTGVHDASHRPLSTPYVVSSVGATIAFLVAPQTSLETAQLLWFGAAGFMLLLPLFINRFREAADREHVEQSLRIRHPLVERFGLLTIIILGENLISIVGGAVYRNDFSSSYVLVISASIAIVFLLWWIYFDLISERLPIQKILHRNVWLYLHLLLTMSIGLVAVGLLNAIEYVKTPEAIDTWFIVGPAAAFLGVIIGLMHTIQKQKAHIPIYTTAARAALVAIVGLLLVGYLELSVLNTVLLSATLLSLPVVFAFMVWIKRNHKEA